MISENFSSVHSATWEINFTQCSPNGELRIVELCNLLQLTAAEHSISGGLSFNDMQAHDQAWVLGKLRLEIDNLPRWREKITITTWIESLEGSQSVRNMEVALDGKRIAGASTLWVVFNTKIRRAQTLALDHGHFEKFVERHSTSKPVGRITVLEEAITISQRTVVLSDLDIVNHVNNIKYLEWCLDSLPVKSVVNRHLTLLEMNFLRELNHGEEVDIKHSSTTNEDAFIIEKGSKASCAIVLNWNRSKD